ncbi:MBL fold metallo-hydrolase [Enterobacterales bacterium CwR94]|nr:MBL fold metallo-hydrolase [Enterobacterales bacterium CwR94]
MGYKNPWYDQQLSHHTPDGFQNPEAELRQPGDLQRWQKARKAAGLPHPPAQGYGAFQQQWWQPADLSGAEDAVWWLGHAAILLRIAGRYTLIDPALSARASPLRFYGPDRKTPSPLDINALPALETLLISHNHYDHLDSRTVRQILRRFPDVQVIVPLGLKRWFQRRGAKYVTELDWWQTFPAGAIEVTAVPARHWSMRTLFDRNRSLWCGFVLRTADWRFWFTGDSGYSDNLLAIVDALGPFDMAALPIGAYAPKWFMRGQHMDPDQSVSLYRYMNQPQTLPMHWGVFELADESLDEPPSELAEALIRAGLEGKTFRPWKMGEKRSLK